MRVRRSLAPLASALMPWALFLVLNLYNDRYGLDRELLQGTALFFQFTFGTLVGLLGLVGYALVGILLHPKRASSATDGG